MKQALQDFLQPQVLRVMPYSGQPTGPFPDGLCPRCRGLKVEERRLSQEEYGDPFVVSYSLKDSLPGLPALSHSARQGCNFCKLLKSILIEFVSRNQRHQWFGNSLIHVSSIAGLDSDYMVLHKDSLYYLKIPLRFTNLSDSKQFVSYNVYFEVEGDSRNRSNITRRPLEPHPLSRTNVAKFKSWLHQCHADHEDCQHERTTKRLPTRLLAVGGELLNESPRIVVSSEHRTLKDCKKTPYIALSHCWGKGITPMKTESHSLPDRLECIPLETMPRTYRDAVLLTRSLGISYLWIDSLCIVQDDKDDWKRESSSMAEVYRNAYLTVCALVTSCNDGLFRGSREPGVRIPVNSKVEGVTGEHFLRFAAVISHDQRILKSSREHYKAIKRSDDAMGSSWSSRGWTFQEELFSTRRLLCCERLIYLDCNTSSCSENSLFSEAISKSLPSRLRNNHAHWFSDWFSDWYDLIPSYSGRSLTHEQDRLPAISSLAALFAERAKDEYIAGLWKSDLPHGLLWHRADDQRDWPTLSDLVKQLTSRSQFIAPSWSWACQGRVSKWRNRDTRNSVECKVLEAWSGTDNINPFGGITGAHLFMEASASNAALGDWRLDFDPTKDDPLDWTKEWKSQGAIMFILTKDYYPSTSSGSFSGLLLYPTACANEYLRIGIFQKTYFYGEEVPDLFEDAPYCKIRLV